MNSFQKLVLSLALLQFVINVSESSSCPRQCLHMGVVNITACKCDCYPAYSGEKTLLSNKIITNIYFNIKTKTKAFTVKERSITVLQISHLYAVQSFCPICAYLIVSQLTVLKCVINQCVNVV